MQTQPRSASACDDAIGRRDLNPGALRLPGLRWTIATMPLIASITSKFLVDARPVRLYGRVTPATGGRRLFTGIKR